MFTSVSIRIYGITACLGIQELKYFQRGENAEQRLCKRLAVPEKLVELVLPVGCAAVVVS